MSWELRWPSVAASLLLLAAPFAGFAQTATLVQDINATPYAPYDSAPSGYTEFNGAVYFSASAAPDEFGLWRTDGTSAGTQLVKSGLVIRQLLVSADALYLVADDGAHGVELWKSDGTEAGTVIVKDINPGPGDGTRPGIVDLNGTLFFTATDGVTGLELWRSDGDGDGTVLLKDIHPSQSSFPVTLTVVNETLFFAAEDETSGIELWKSDGTTPGTVLVKDINPGPDRGFPNSMLSVGGVLLFRADDGVNGSELWRSDGTPGGTVMVRDIDPGAASSAQDVFDPSLFAFDGLAFFGANSNGSFGLWKSDGTLAGTELVQGDLLPAVFAAIGATLYFREAGQQIPGFAASLWKTDGTAAGTQLVHPLDEGNFGDDLVVVGDTLFFSAGPTFFDHDLWKSDGTPEGTVALKNIGRGVHHQFAAIGETLYLSAETDENGQEPWTSDGTANGTGLLKDIGIAPGGSIANHIVTANDSINPFATALGRLYFAAADGVHGVELWKTDGTQQGTSMVKDINPTGPFGVHAEAIVNLNGKVFFAADDAVHGYELWRSDGTENGTVLVKDIHSEVDESGFPRDLVELNGVLFFSATDAVNGSELWRSDGTEAGTTIVKDIAPGILGSLPFSLRVNGDWLFFIANDGVNGAALWKSDGTSAGTVLLKDIRPNNQDDSYYELVSSGGLLYFRVEAGDGHELWRSDGTPEGTFPLHTITPAPNLFAPAWLIDVDGTLFFFQGDELWKSDGTEPGTTLVKDLNVSPVLRSDPASFASYNGQLFFVAAGNPTELWRSDGTTAGTVAIKEFAANSVTPQVTIIGQAGGALFLNVAADNGYQLWRTHGTAESTTAIPNLFLGAVGPLASLGSNVFFAAATKEEGRELWAAALLPAISSGGVVDAAGFQPTLAPGSLASLFGVELSTTTEAAQSQPLPTSLAGARIQVNGVDAPLLFVSPQQINFQVPFETVAGAASVVAILGEQQSPGEPVAVSEFAPSLFVNPNTGEPIVQRHADGELIRAQNPALPGEILVLYVTGIGGLDNPPATGAPATDSPLASATVLPTVTVGGVEVEVLFAGLAPDFVGLGQINIQLPAGLPRGSPLPLVISFGGNESQPLQLPF